MRIRSGAVQLPRQNLPPTTPTATAASPGNAPIAGAGGPPAAAAGSLGTTAGAAVAAGVTGAAIAANPAGSWPANNGGNTARQPSRYDPPSNAPPAAPAAAAPVAPAVDPRANYSSNASQANPATATPSGVARPSIPTAIGHHRRRGRIPHRSNRALPGRTQPANFPARRGLRLGSRQRVACHCRCRRRINRPPARFHSPPGRD